MLAQRLVRRICETCAVARPPDQGELLRLGLDPDCDTSKVRAGAGCEQCRGTGYRGRVGIFELLEVDGNVRREIVAHATASQIGATAVTSGMKTLRDDGIARVMNGITTVEEVIRVTMRQGD